MTNSNPDINEQAELDHAEPDQAEADHSGQGQPSDAKTADRHAQKMAKRKQLQDAKAAARTQERGLFIVNTGKGKGKSTAAFGMALRAIAHGKSVGIVQFIKGAWRTGEHELFNTLREKLGAEVSFRAMGEGFTWDTADKERDIAAARAAWQVAEELLGEDGPDMVVLDELNIALRYDYLQVDEVIAAISSRRADQHVVVTGRNAKAELMEAADTVSIIEANKHHAAAGVRAQPGIEF